MRGKRGRSGSPGYAPAQPCLFLRSYGAAKTALVGSKKEPDIFAAICPVLFFVIVSGSFSKITSPSEAHFAAAGRANCERSALYLYKKNSFSIQKSPQMKKLKMTSATISFSEIFSL